MFLRFKVDMINVLRLILIEKIKREKIKVLLINSFNTETLKEIN